MRDGEVGLPEPARSRVLLIGTGVYDDPALPPLASVAGNVTDLADVLTSPWSLELPAEHCTVVRDPAGAMEVGEQLERVAEEAEDLLLVYFAGHGLVDERGRLHLGLRTTLSGRLRWSALPFEHVRECIAGSRARNRVLILDCCFSGRAIEAMADPASLASAQIEITGTYTLTSTSATAPSHAPVGARHTAFTGALLDLLRSGVPDGPELLTFHVIYQHLLRRLAADGRPRPEQRGTLTTDRLALARNRAPVSPPPPPPPPPAPGDGGAATQRRAQGDPTRRVSFGKPVSLRTVRMRQLATAVVSVLLLGGLLAAAVANRWGWNATVVIALGGGAMGVLAYSLASRRRPHLVLTRSTLTYTNFFGQAVEIPWPDVDFVGLLHRFDSPDTTGEDVVTHRNLLLLRLRATAGDFGLSRMEGTVPRLLGCGYHALCALDDLDADPVRLRDTVVELAEARYLTNDELLNLDPRLN